MNKKTLIPLITIAAALLTIFVPPLLKKTNDFLAGAVAGFGAVISVVGMILIFRGMKKK